MPFSGVGHFGCSSRPEERSELNGIQFSFHPFSTKSLGRLNTLNWQHPAEALPLMR